MSVLQVPLRALVFGVAGMDMGYLLVLYRSGVPFVGNAGMFVASQYSLYMGPSFCVIGAGGGVVSAGASLLVSLTYALLVSGCY